jgi:hypothetical protein
MNFFFFPLMTYPKPKQGLTIEAVHSGVDVFSLNLQLFGNNFVVERMCLSGTNLHGVF